MQTRNSLALILGVVILNVVQEETFAYRILGVFPILSKSSIITGHYFLYNLAAVGHNITFVATAEGSREVPFGVRYLQIPGLSQNPEAVIPSLLKSKDWSMIYTVYKTFKYVTASTEYVLKSDTFQSLLNDRRERFDLIFMDVMAGDAFLGLGRHFNAPIVGLSAMSPTKWVTDLVGSPLPSSYVPHYCSMDTRPMGIWSRTLNVMYYTIEHVLKHYTYRRWQNDLLRDTFPKQSDTNVDRLRKHFALALVNSHHLINFPRPVVPSIMEISGFHIIGHRVQTNTKMPQSLQEFLDNAPAGFIYCSFGTNINVTDFPLETYLGIKRALERVEPKVLFRYDFEWPDKKDKIFVASSFQQDIILSKRLALMFITTGGTLSMLEALHHAVPIIGIPFTSEQIHNVDRAVADGRGLKIMPDDLSAEAIELAVAEILLHHKRYIGNAHNSAIKFKIDAEGKYPMAMDHIAYIIENSDVYMRSKSVPLSVWTYYNFDIWPVYIACIVCILGAPIMGLWLICYYCCYFIRKMRFPRKYSDPTTSPVPMLSEYHQLMPSPAERPAPSKKVNKRKKKTN